MSRDPCIARLYLPQRNQSKEKRHRMKKQQYAHLDIKEKQNNFLNKLKGCLSEKAEYTPQGRPIALDNCNLCFEHHLYDENGQRASPTATFPTGSLSVSLSSPHYLKHIATPLSFPWHSILLYWVFSVLFMDRTDKQQQLSLAKSSRQRCNEWFVCCSFPGFLAVIYWSFCSLSYECKRVLLVFVFLLKIIITWRVCFWCIFQRFSSAHRLFYWEILITVMSSSAESDICPSNLCFCSQ